MMLTAERLHEVLDYDQETGLFRWRVRTSNRVVVGAIAGHLDKVTGYITLRIDRQLWQAHRLAFMWMTGALPPKEVDHRDLNRANNAWCNLRPATKAQNKANQIVRKDSKTGIKGAQLTPSGTYYSRIRKDGKAICLGTFSTKEAANHAYREAANRLFGEFARF